MSKMKAIQQNNITLQKGKFKKTFKNAEKLTPTMLCPNAGSVAKLVVGGNEFQTLTTLSAKN